MTQHIWHYATFIAGENMATGDYCYVDADDRAWRVRSSDDVFVGAAVWSAHAGEAVQLVSPDRLTFVRHQYADA